MTAQILAAVIFVGMFALIIMDKFERQYVTLGSAALVLVVVFGICMHSWDAIKNALNLGAFFRTDFWYGASESASSGVNWSTIFFITGMMIMVEGLGKSGFFPFAYVCTVFFDRKFIKIRRILKDLCIGFLCSLFFSLCNGFLRYIINKSENKSGNQCYGKKNCRISYHIFHACSPPLPNGFGMVIFSIRGTRRLPKIMA